MGWTDWLLNRPGEAQQRSGLLGQAGGQAEYAKQGASAYGQLGGQLGGQADYLRRIQSGQESVSAEQLRQANQQTVAAQHAMAASASPQNSTMAALMGSRNAMQASSGLAGQQAVAGIQERQGATAALNQMLLEQRRQEQQAALQGSQNAMNGYQAVQPGASWWDRFGGAVKGGMTLAGMGGMPWSGAGRGPVQPPGLRPQDQRGRY